jgi:prophage regulatory protein
MAVKEVLSDRDRKVGEQNRRLCRVLRLPEVMRITGRKRTAIYQDIAEGLFPPPIPLGQRAVGWLEDELLDWQQQQIAARDEKRARAKTMTPSQQMPREHWRDTPTKNDSMGTRVRQWRTPPAAE